MGRSPCGRKKGSKILASWARSRLLLPLTLHFSSCPLSCEPCTPCGLIGGSQTTDTSSPVRPPGLLRVYLYSSGLILIIAGLWFSRISNRLDEEWFSIPFRIFIIIVSTSRGLKVQKMKSLSYKMNSVPLGVSLILALANQQLALDNSQNFFGSHFSPSENGKVELHKIQSTLQIYVL